MATITADEYREIVKSIINTAAGGSVYGSYPWNALNKGTYTAQDFYDLMQTRAVKKAGYDAVLNADGSVRTYTYINKNGKIADLGSYDDIAGAFNSNYQNGTASAGTVQFTQIADTKVNEPTETVSHSWVGTTGKLSHYDKGIAGAGEFVFGSVLPAIGAAATGITLGKLIDKGIYEVGTNVFGADNLEAFNPDTWGTITAGDDSLGAKAFNTIFGIDPDNGNTQMYLDENAIAYLTAYLGNLGAFSYETLIEDSDYKGTNIGNITFPIIVNSLPITYTSIIGNYKQTIYLDSYTSKVVASCFITDYNADAYELHLHLVSSNPFDFTVKTADSQSENSATTKYTLNNKDFYYAELILHPIKSTFDYSYNNYIPSSNPRNLIDYILLYGASDISNIKGITNQPDATQFDPTNISDWRDISHVLDELKKQYPELWDNRVENSVVQPDGTTKTYIYVPVPMPTGGTADEPTTEGAKQSKREVDPSTATDTLLNTLIQILTQTIPSGMTDTPTDPINPNPPDTGDGDTPVVIPPTGSASALYSIYNPSQSQLNSFGAWLWSSNFVDQLLKLFNDPMQAIIGLHKVFATPPISGSGTIKVGYLDSGVASNIVGNQYTTVDCGSVNLYEYYGNVFDYDPFTKVNLYLPFIGIVPLKVGEIMRSTIHIIYHVDVLTGACLAEVKINRDSAGGTLFQYSGNAAVQYPISSGSYMSIISGIMSLAGGVAGTIATGGAAMPVLLGAGASVGRMHTDISHSGSFSGNAGAMGIKKPYLIIDRPQTALAKNFSNYIGYPSNFTATIGSCTGFIKVIESHVENTTATNSELNEIDSILKEGVLV